MNPVILTAIITAAATIIVAVIPLWFKSNKDIEDAKKEMYAVQNASHEQEKRFEIEERIRISLRMQAIVDKQDVKLDDLAKELFGMKMKLQECDEERHEYKHTMIRQASELKLAMSHNEMLQEIIVRQNKIIDTFTAKLENP